jgi:hypothetical protein
VDPTEKYIGKQPPYQLRQIWTYSLHCRCHQRCIRQRPHKRSSPDLQTMLWTTPKDASDSDISCVISDSDLHSTMSRNTRYQSASSFPPNVIYPDLPTRWWMPPGDVSDSDLHYPIVRDPDLPTTSWMPAKDVSGSALPSNRKRSILTDYVADATETSISQRLPIPS